MATPFKFPPSINGIQKTLDAQLLSGVTASMTLNNVTGIQNKVGVCVIDAKDGNGKATPDKREYIIYTGVSGSTLTTLTRNADGGGSDQDHAVGAIVQFVPDALAQQAIIDALLLLFTEAGALDTTKVVTPTGTQTLTNKTLTSPKINEDVALTSTATELNLLSGETSLVTADSTTTFSNKDLTSSTNTFADIVYTNSLARQAIINGNFDVWQRGTSIAMTAADAYTADRWYCETATAGTDKTVSQEDGTGVNGSRYCARVKMVDDVDELLTFSQALESQDSIKFRGQKVTLSFYARGGAEFVADNATLVSKIVTGKGTDQKVLAFTASADGVSQNNTLTTGWQKFTCTTTAAIAADITQIGVSFAFTHAGSGTTTNYFEITQVQLCAGEVALPFMPKSYDNELRDCKRYYYQPNFSTQSAYQVYFEGHCISTTAARFPIQFQTTMRDIPTLSTSTINTLGVVNDGSITATIALTALSIAAQSVGKDTAVLYATVAGGLTTDKPLMLLNNNTSGAFIAFSAEL